LSNLIFLAGGFIMKMGTYDPNLGSKLHKAENILVEKTKIFANLIAIPFTGSKETMVILDLIRNMNKGKVPFPIIHIDTGLETEELYDYRKNIQREWNLDIKIVSRQGFLSSDDIAQDAKNCCKKLKEDGLLKAAGQYGWKALIFEPRDNGYEEIVEAGISVVNPVAHFHELDFWRYIKQRNLPYCSLYRKGFRLVACEPCLRPWLRKIKPAPKNKEEIISRLKNLGYF
jgi:phosphoadenosine phosphosulfate reductase